MIYSTVAFLTASNVPLTISMKSIVEGGRPGFKNLMIMIHNYNNTSK